MGTPAGDVEGASHLGGASSAKVGVGHIGDVDKVRSSPPSSKTWGALPARRALKKMLATPAYGVSTETSGHRRCGTAGQRPRSLTPARKRSRGALGGFWSPRRRCGSIWASSFRELPDGDHLHSGGRLARTVHRLIARGSFGRPYAPAGPAGWRRPRKPPCCWPGPHGPRADLVHRRSIAASSVVVTDVVGHVGEAHPSPTPAA